VAAGKGGALALDRDWLYRHPLPQPDEHTDKNGRGRVLAIGGSRSVPGGICLSAEAALRAGAGKVKIATVAETALAIGLAMPECAVIGLAPDEAGEIADADPAIAVISSCDAVMVGPAMTDAAAGGRVVDALLDAAPDCAVVLDAAALMELAPRAARLRRRKTPTILTPHVGEMAHMLGCDAAVVQADREGQALHAAQHFGAVVVLKGSTSLIATPEGELLAFAGGGVGLATGGSGDVLAGIAAAFAAHGAPPRDAAAWAVWLHGEAGRRCAEQIGPVGFLARELLGHLPGLLGAF
jgi:hydroxyethylthiazole kinase-like uncharacterized protein yjeF